MKLSITIPAYNKESEIGSVIGQILAVEIPGIEKEIIVVDDGSSDRTGEIARSKGAVVVRHFINSWMFDVAGMPPSKRIANRLANLITRVLFGIRTTDLQSGLRVLSRSTAERIWFTANNYEVSSEICGEVCPRHPRFVEVPIRTVYTNYSLAKGQGFGTGLKTLVRLFLSRRLM